MSGDYDRFAPYYDAFYRASVDYLGDVEYLQRVFETHSLVPVRRILDLGCGTGEHALRLAQRGFDVDGLDASPAMVDEARRKAREAESSDRARFHVGDMARDAPPGPFDAAVSMFAAFCYLLTDEQAGRALDLVRARLPSGGLFVFESWNTRGWAPREMRGEADLGNARRIVRLTTPRNSAPGDVYRFTFEHVLYEGETETERFAEEHALRLRTPEETRALVEAHGFDVPAFTVGPLIGKTLEPPAPNDFRVICIARKR